MNIELLYDTPPWDWPADAGDRFLELLEDRSADANARLLAAEMAGNPVVIDDQIAAALLAVLGNPEESPELRCEAALALGPALEHAYEYEFEDPDDVLLSEQAYDAARAALHRLFEDTGLPQPVRRRILEAAVRAPQAWHRDAMRKALADDDQEWQLTAIFCTRFIRGFEEQITTALSSGIPQIRYQAMLAAGMSGLETAWPEVVRILEDERSDKALLLAAIEAVPEIRPEEAEEVLGHLVEAEDEDIADAVFEALALAEGILEGDEDLDEAFDEDDDRILH